MAASQDIPIIRVLMALHPGMDTLDFTGPLEVLSSAKHNVNDDSKSFPYDIIQSADLLNVVPSFFHEAVPRTSQIAGKASQRGEYPH